MLMSGVGDGGELVYFGADGPWLVDMIDCLIVEMVCWLMVE